MKGWPSAVAAPHAIKRVARARDLNDAFRRSFSGGRVVVTADVAALPEAASSAIVAAVRGFERVHAEQ